MAYFLVIILFVTQNSAWAGGMRCANRLVEEGDSQAQVLLLCGEPQFRIVVSEESHLVKTGYGAVVHNVVHEAWTYNLGPGSFLRTLHFQNNTLGYIELGDKP